MIWTDEEDRRDPYALEGEPDPEGFRDYTLYAIDVPGRVLLPIPPIARLCASCGRRLEVELPRFGEGVLLDLDQPVCSCGAKPDLARDRAELRNGAVFLFEELACRAALSIELPRAPQSEELPDAQVAAPAGHASTDERRTTPVLPPSELAQGLRSSCAPGPLSRSDRRGERNATGGGRSSATEVHRVWAGLPEAALARASEELAAGASRSSRTRRSRSATGISFWSPGCSSSWWSAGS